MYFDGSDVGLNRNDVDAFAILSDGTLLISVNRDATIGGLAVDDADIIRFIPTSLGSSTSGTFEMYFDGSDVGLDSGSEDVDAVVVMGDGSLLISTVGSNSVPGVSGRDEDLLQFVPTSLGANTAGTWSMYFDGSDVGLRDRREDVWGAWMDANGDLYLTTQDVFTVSGVSGDGADIFVCSGTFGSSTSCTFSMFWDGSANGFAGEVMDAFYIQR
ncbi:MAG: hypothetical protein D6706_13420 [Chloroflexi bacterium]|nr:MAG: hypothetical protein D6706_13420 [Chloroflexota bacterium]